jgi:hypothetical protein
MLLTLFIKVNFIGGNSMAITDIFLNFKKQIQTSDQQRDEELKTHYYKGNTNQLFETIEQIIRQDADSRITTVSKERGEIAVEITKPIPCFMVVTIVSNKPLETAVDFTISTEKTFPFGAYPVLRKRVISFYERIDKLHT